MSPAQLSKWLRKTPQPATIVIDDGKRLDVGNRKWTEVARSIEAIGANKLTAVDGQGNIIRAIVIDDSESDDGGGGKSELQGDLQALSKIVADAYEKGTQAPAKLLDAAMTFIERQGQRLVAQDREIERLRLINARQAAEIMQLKSIPVSEGDEDGGIMGALMQGVMQGQLAAAPAEAIANGRVRK